MPRVQIKMSDTVYNTMTFKAKALGISNSELVRSLIMDKDVISSSSHKDYTRALGLLGNLTNNINQIALNLNIANKEGSLNDINYDNLINMLTVILNNAESCIND